MNEREIIKATASLLALLIEETLDNNLPCTPKDIASFLRNIATKDNLTSMVLDHVVQGVDAT